jgi:FtsP/CotA-like multicopper oxidase with cupredoxin domain
VPTTSRRNPQQALPGGAYEIPIVIQDRSFNADGSLFYASTRAFFDGYAGPYVGDPNVNTPSDIAPIWNPEFFGNTMVVNGKTWPYLNVEQRKYRFRFLNGSDSRFLILRFNTPDNKLPFNQIGTEGGFLPGKVVLNQLLIGPAERADVVVDFSKMPAGTTITLLNVGPDSPFGGLPIPTAAKSDPATTGQVMQFRVTVRTAADTSVVPPLPALTPIAISPTTPSRKVSLNELESALVCVDGANVYVPGVTPPACSRGSVPIAPLEARLGTVDANGLGVPLPFMAPSTENPTLNSTEIWEIHNFTVDAHPIHIHQVMFQVVDRTPMGQVIGGKKTRAPELWEKGFKDTVTALPGEITRIKAKFDILGQYIWHCHILSHEDNEMMRPFQVVP